MRTRTRSIGIRTAAFVWPVIVLGIASVSAQETSQTGETAKAIKELTGEVRSLRAVIERTSESQLQGQILGLYLNLQQNRVVQANSRLDIVSRELEGLGNRARGGRAEGQQNGVGTKRGSGATGQEPRGRSIPGCPD